MTDQIKRRVTLGDISKAYALINDFEKGPGGRQYKRLSKALKEGPFGQISQQVDRINQVLEPLINFRRRVSALFPVLPDKPGADDPGAPVPVPEVAPPAPKARKPGGRPSKEPLILGRAARLRRQNPELKEKPLRVMANEILASFAAEGVRLDRHPRTIENILSRWERQQRPVPGEINHLIDDGVYTRLVPVGSKPPRRKSKWGGR